MADVAKIWGKDSLSVLVPISDQENDLAPLDLSSATVEAAARKTNGTGAVFPATATIQSPATDGKVLVSFARETFLGAPGAYTCQVRVRIGNDAETPSEFTFTVRPSIVAA